MTSQSLTADLVTRGEVRISYEFDISTRPVSRLQPPQSVDFSNESSVATKTFLSSFFGDRLGVHLGPLVFSHTYERKRGRVNFKDQKSIFDLRATDGRIAIMPHEGMTVSSIENIALQASTACIILPRLTLATAGLLVCTTYIDPYWEGILQLFIENTTPHPYELSFGERIAICRFYTVLGTPQSPEAQRRFAQKSHHFALNWTKILDSDADPHPLRKKPLKDSWSDRLQRGVINFGQKYWVILIGTGALTVLALVGGWLVSYGSLTERLKDVTDLKTIVKRTEAAASELNATVSRLVEKQVEVGRAEITIQSGDDAGSLDIPLDRTWISSDVAWVDVVEGDPSIHLQHSLLRDSQRSGKTILHIAAQRMNSQPAPSQVGVRWLVGPR